MLRNKFDGGDCTNTDSVQVRSTFFLDVNSNSRFAHRTARWRGVDVEDGAEEVPVSPDLKVVAEGSDFWKSSRKGSRVA